MRRLFSLWALLFKVPTLEEIMEHEAEKAQREVQQSASVVRNHLYQQHMANRRLDAIHEWRVKEQSAS